MMQQSGSSSGIRPFHGAVVVVSVVVAGIIAFAAFSFVVGVIAFIVKLAIVIGILYGVTRLVLRSSRK